MRYRELTNATAYTVTFTYIKPDFWHRTRHLLTASEALELAAKHKAAGAYVVVQRYGAVVYTL